MVQFTLNLVDLTLVLAIIVYLTISTFKGSTGKISTIFFTLLFLLLLCSSYLFRMLVIALLAVKLLDLQELDFLEHFKNKEHGEKESHVEHHESTEEIDAIVEAASDMSKDGVGALLVLSKDGDVGKFGIPVDANVSREMLESLFFPGTPLHDGAIVLDDDGKITKAGAVIPLSEDDDDDSLPKDAGTRHRAAISASKNSNVYVCIVVSEERNDVSVVINGKIYSDLDKEEVRDILVEKTNLANK